MPDRFDATSLMDKFNRAHRPIQSHISSLKQKNNRINPVKRNSQDRTQVDRQDDGQKANTFKL